MVDWSLLGAGWEPSGAMMIEYLSLSLISGAAFKWYWCAVALCVRCLRALWSDGQTVIEEVIKVMKLVHRRNWDLVPFGESGVKSSGGGELWCAYTVAL